QSKLRIDIDRLGFVQCEYVRIFKLQDRVRVELPRIARIPLLGVRIAVLRIHDTTYRASGELSGRRRNRWQRIDAKTPAGRPVDTQYFSSRSWHDVAGT